MIHMRRILIVIAALAVLVATTAPAFAGEAVPFRGTYAGEDFSEDCDPIVTLKCVVEIQLDTNLGPATQHAEFSLVTLAIHGNGGLHFFGSATWDFGGGDLLHTQLTGVFSFVSGLAEIHEKVIGGEGIYEGATGTIHTSDLGRDPETGEPLGGSIAGVIILN